VKIKFVLIAFFVIFAFSCKEKINIDIIGNWQSSITMKSELANPDNPEKTFANIYLKQSISFSFFEDGKFTRNILQAPQKAESFSEAYTSEDILKYFSEKPVEVTLYGNYKIENDILTMDTYEIEKNGEKIPYDEYYEIDQSQGPVEVSIKISRENDVLSIAGVNFKKN